MALACVAAGAPPAAIAAKPAHARPDNASGKRDATSVSCRHPKRVRFVVAGSLTALTDAGVRVRVARTNRHARHWLEHHLPRFETTGAALRFLGMLDRDANGTVDLADAVPGDRVRVVGKLSLRKRRCATRSSLLVRRIKVSATATDALRVAGPKGDKDHRGKPVPDPLPPPPTTPAPPATPLWNGDSFTIDPYAVYHGGEGALPPYLWSSASGPYGGWFQPHSNTNPGVHGVTVVADPTGLARNVIQLNADERRSYSETYVRAEIRGPQQLGPGMDRWVIAEVFVPTDVPTMPTTSKWWTVLSIYGPPYRGASQNSFHMQRNAAGTDNDFTWPTPGGTVLWRTPATKGVWHIIARRIKFSTDAAQGSSEIWYSRRDAAGNPTGPLVQQALSGGVRRRYYKTLDPNINWDGSTPNHADLKNYHSANMWPGRTYTPLDFARFRIYDGTTPMTEIDPYYTGLK